MKLAGSSTQTHSTITFCHRHLITYWPVTTLKRSVTAGHVLVKVHTINAIHTDYKDSTMHNNIHRVVKTEKQCCNWKRCHNYGMLNSKLLGLNSSQRWHHNTLYPTHCTTQSMHLQLILDWTTGLARKKIIQINKSKTSKSSQMEIITSACALLIQVGIMCIEFKGHNISFYVDVPIIWTFHTFQPS